MRGCFELNLSPKSTHNEYLSNPRVSTDFYKWQHVLQSIRSILRAFYPSPIRITGGGRAGAQHPAHAGASWKGGLGAHLSQLSSG